MYKLEKMSDDAFNGKHPNGIAEGMTWGGNYLEKPTIGESFTFISHVPGVFTLNTSKVIEVVDENVFKTRNSTYKLTEIKDKDNMYKLTYSLSKARDEFNSISRIVNSCVNEPQLWNASKLVKNFDKKYPNYDNFVGGYRRKGQDGKLNKLVEKVLIKIRTKNECI